MTSYGLPFLPGNSQNDPTRQRYHLSNSLGYKNGYQLQNQPRYEIGGGKIELSILDQAEVKQLEKEHLELQYKTVSGLSAPDFIPDHVKLDKKVIHFKGYYSEEIVESPIETERVRYLDVYYYLTDDTVMISEPHIQNSGITQGKFLSRKRLPINGVFLHWKELNTAMDIVVYEKTIRLYKCDEFTRDFLTSEGIEVNPNELPPQDFYLHTRAPKELNYLTPTIEDPLHKFLTMDRIVLRFYAIWDEREQLFGEVRKFLVHFYMADDTLEVREIHEKNNGRDPFPVLLARQKMPKKMIAKTYPSVEKDIISENEGFYGPRDLVVGAKIEIAGRNMLLYDCDPATRSFGQARIGITHGPAVDVGSYFHNAPPPEYELPEYNGFGGIEDSAQNCLKIAPDRPKKNYLKMLINGNQKLRFKAKMVGRSDIDNTRNFVFEIRLSDDLIAIHEIPQKNSGMRTGRFLEPSRISKPGSSYEYYGVNDFIIGSTIIAFQHRFVLTDCDLHVKGWVEANENNLSPDFISSIKNHFQ